MGLICGNGFFRSLIAFWLQDEIGRRKISLFRDFSSGFCLINICKRFLLSQVFSHSMDLDLNIICGYLSADKRSKYLSTSA